MGADTTDLADVKGVGEVTLEELNEAGVETVDGLARAAPSDLPFSQSKSETLIERANRETIVLQTGAQAAAEDARREYMPTGMDAFDEMLGGGWKEGHVVGIPGAADTGKTQVAFSSIAHAVDQTGSDAVYIETEKDRFSVDRIAEVGPLSREEVEEKVWRVPAHSLQKQRDSYGAVADQLDDVCLVVVDSFNQRFRLIEGEYDGINDLPDRNAEFSVHLTRIEDMVTRLNCPALLTLQVYGNPDAYSAEDVRTWGGELVAHTLTYMVKLTQARGHFREAHLGGHPEQGSGEVLLTIGEELSAHEEEP